MKESIALLGNYGHHNLGDEAILQGFLDSTLRVRPDLLPLLVFTDAPTDTSSRYESSVATATLWRRPLAGRLWRVLPVLNDVFLSVRRTRHLVLAGGGLVNDSNPTSLLLYTAAALIAVITRTSLHAIGISIGPLEARWSRTLARILLRRCETVWVRDSTSLELARRLGCYDATLIPDAALALESPVKREGKAKQLKTARSISISILPLGRGGSWYRVNCHQYARYRELISRLVVQLVRERRVSVILLAINVVHDTRAIDDVVCALPQDVRAKVQIALTDTVWDVMDAVSVVDAVIASRLHSAVLATVVATPFVTLAYQEKVSAFAKDTGLGRFVRDVDAVECLEVLEMICSLENQLESHSAALADFSLAARAEFDYRWASLLDMLAPAGTCAATRCGRSGARRERS